MIGSYLLILSLSEDRQIRIGSLGAREFRKGYYVYVGSALGKNMGIERRLSRHRHLVLNKKRSLRWHIDYLLVNEAVKLEDVISIPSKERLECELSRRVEKLSERVVRGFGSSDCKRSRCRGHLHFFRTNPTDSILRLGLRSDLSGG